MRRVPRTLFAFFGTKGLRLVLNTATAALVVMLPYTAATSARAESSPADVASPSFAVQTFAVQNEDIARAQTSARSVVAGTRSPLTVAAEEARPVIERTIAKEDTLSTMAHYYDLSLESVAYANGINEEDQRLPIGDKLLIPPGEGALHKVKDGDTVEALADRFKVDPAAIMSYNRVYFEPERFAVGQLVFVPGATLPALKRTERNKTISIPASASVAGAHGSSRPTGQRRLHAVLLVGPQRRGHRRAVWLGPGRLRRRHRHRDRTGPGGRTARLHPAPRWPRDLLLPHERRVRDPRTDVARGQLIAAIGLTGVTTALTFTGSSRSETTPSSCRGL